jgi:hypothetical protein
MYCMQQYMTPSRVWTCCCQLSNPYTTRASVLFPADSDPDRSNAGQLGLDTHTCEGSEGGLYVRAHGAGKEVVCTRLHVQGGREGNECVACVAVEQYSPYL